MRTVQGSLSPTIGSSILLSILFLSRAVVRQADVARRNVAVQAHPLSDCLYRAEIAMDTCVNALLPASVFDAGVAADIAAMGLAVWHALAAFLTAFKGRASCAVGVAVWESVSSDGFDEGVRGK